MNAVEVLDLIKSNPAMIEKIEINIVTRATPAPIANRKQPKHNPLEQEYLRLLDRLGPTPDGDITFAMYSRLARTKPGMKILVFGAGLSAIVAASRGATVTVVEHSKERMDQLISHLTGDVMLIHSAADNSGWYGWKAEYGTLFDVIVLDGPVLLDACKAQESRAAVIGRVKHLLTAGGAIFIDDTNHAALSSLANEMSVEMGLKAYGYGGQNENGARKYHVLMPQMEKKGEGPGTELQRILKSHGHAACQPCEKLARQMNKWGVSGCEERFAEIVEDMLERAKAWFAQEKPVAFSLFKFVAGEKYTDEAVRTMIAIPVREAINACKPK